MGEIDAHKNGNGGAKVRAEDDAARKKEKGELVKKAKAAFNWIKQHVWDPSKRCGNEFFLHIQPLKPTQSGRQSPAHNTSKENDDQMIFWAQELEKHSFNNVCVLSNDAGAQLTAKVAGFKALTVETINRLAFQPVKKDRSETHPIKWGGYST